MKKVLEVAYPALNNSGVPAVIMGIIRELHDEFQFDVLVFRSEIGFHEKEFRSYGGKIYTIKCDVANSRFVRIIEKIFRPWRLFWGMKKILKNDNYDVVHCHNGWDSGWCLLAAKVSGVKIRVVHSHASRNPFEVESTLVKIYHRIMRKIINSNATIKIGCSQIAADNLYGDKVKTKVVRNAADLNRFTSKAGQDNFILKQSPRFAFVGRITSQKNPIFLLEIFSEILKNRKGSTLKIVGFGDLENKVREKISELKIENNVELMPHSSDVPELLRNVDAFILPSYFEGLPVVLVEAQIMGVQCFASETIAKESSLGICKFISLSIGVKGWAKKIIDTIDKAPDVKKLPENDIMMQYSWNRIADEYRAIYNGGEA